MGVVNVMISSSTGVAPDLLTVEEAARALRIGRTSAYAPVPTRILLAVTAPRGSRCGGWAHLLRVPWHGLQELVGGPITWPIPDEASYVSQQPTPVIGEFDTRTCSDRRPRPRPSQQPLPLPS